MPGAAATRTRLTVLGSDGAQISVVVSAPGSTAPHAPLPVIVAIHGFATSADIGWDRTGHLAELTAAGRTVIAIDLRGHGQSTKPRGARHYRSELLVSDIIAAAHAAGTPDQVDLLGYSLGGRLAWTVAQRGLLPVRRVVVGGFDGRTAFHGMDDKRAHEIIAMFPGNDEAALRDFMEGMAGSPADHASEILELPTLVVVGERDRLAASAERFAGTLPDGAFLSVPGRSHASVVTAPQFRAAVVEFLGRD